MAQSSAADKPVVFRDFVTADGRFKPEADRYHLYVSLGCPFACRCLAVLYMKGLEHVIGVSVTHPTFQRTRPNDHEDTHCGWVFAKPTDPPLAATNGKGSFPCTGCTPDTVNGVRFVRDLYEMAGAKKVTFSVPVLWDKKEKTIVNNESPEIMRMLNSAFNALAKHPELDLYPEALQSTIDDAAAWVGPHINMAVYRCGFAADQAAYDAGFKDLFAGLDRAEALLGGRRYLTGDCVTEVDIKLFMTLIRFDEAYFVCYKTNKKLIRDYPNLCNYVRDLYHIPGIGRTVDMYHIKAAYFTCKPELNVNVIIPGGGEAWWSQPHDRADKFGGKGGRRGALGWLQQLPVWAPHAAASAAAALVVGAALGGSRRR
ncbi:hypothetical protein HXX76_004322 [Chlamydomonas incerta]|uniref:GST C-terminal domain-containing protein n=1 Tax=Chlamydomonas incerta TaxID=51695 RepID=A0A835TM32_CHLIN|nr:hypothetical protein HXX76_004322 [Chlamydomonas incerta]|eukprot:KAG2440210.1 hypothetical protein HXX76_004322 [Chlamydomonas incerta]